jgi:hypothetical protein
LLRGFNRSRPVAEARRLAGMDVIIFSEGTLIVRKRNTSKIKQAAVVVGAATALAVNAAALPNPAYAAGDGTVQLAAGGVVPLCVEIGEAGIAG